MNRRPQIAAVPLTISTTQQVMRSKAMCVRRKARHWLVLILFLFTGLQTIAQQPNPATWVTNGSVNALVTDGTSTYIGGSFSYIGPNTGGGVALTTTSASYNTSFPKVGGTVYAVVSDGSGGWYIGGSFSQVGATTRNNLAHILSDGSVDATWDPNPSSGVQAIAINGTDIYVSGYFTTIGGQTRNNIAKLNNTNGDADATWNPNPDGSVSSIAVAGSDLYVCGSFSTIGGESRSYVAKLNNSNGNADPSWNANASSSMQCVSVSGTDVYVGGFFSSIGGQTRNYIAKLNTSDGNADVSWDANPNSPVTTITLDGTDVYVGGYFSSIGGQSRNRIAKLNNTTGAADVNWDANANNSPNSIAVSSSYVYVGGGFFSIGGQSINRIARVDKTTGAVDVSWNPNAASFVNVVAIAGSDIYVGGSFSSVNGYAVNRLAKLNNATGLPDPSWNPSADNTVWCLAITGSDIYVGGEFSSVGGQSRNRIAKLNNTTGAADASWDANAGNRVYTLAIAGSDIYAGGEFTSIGGLSRNRIAKLNNSTGAADVSWDANADQLVWTIATNGSDIYAGGSFNSIGGQTIGRIAKLNNTTGAADASWNSNANDWVRAIAINGSDIYVGGQFTSIGGQSRNRIAKLDNTNGNADVNWDPNASYTVWSIAVDGTDVYAGGDFFTIGGQSRNKIARLNNTTGLADSWNPNFSDMVRAIELDAGRVYVGGQFTYTGGQPQPYIANLPSWKYTWTGAVSNDYNTAGNWNPSGVPSATDKVIIPSGTANAPDLNNTTFTVSDFIQNSGQTLSLGSGNMNVTGAFTNNGTITGTGKVVLNGSAAQTISGTGTVSNLELNNSNGISIGNTSSDTVKLTGLLTLTAGTLTTNDKLVLKSTASDQAAMLGPVPSSGAAISGNVIHERYLSAPGNGSGGRSWRLLTSPLSNNATDNSIFYHWQNNGINDGTGIELFSPSGTGTAGNGLTQGGVNPSIRTYDAVTNTYQNVTNTKTTMLFTGTRNNTFLAFVPGYYGSGNITGGSGITNADATGSLVTGTQTYTFTPPSTSNIYYLMGNPYACPIDFDKVFLNSGTQNINRKFWVVDPNLSNIGAYVTVNYDTPSSTYITSVGNQNQFIQTGQGFFVEGNSIGNQSTVVIEEDDKETAAAQTAIFRTNGGSLETFRMNLYKSINSTPTLLDGTVITGHQNNNNAITKADAGKFGNFNENISIWKGNNTWLAIESRSLLDNNDTVSVAVSNMQQTNYQLEFEPANMNVPGLTAMLIDNFTNTTTPISLSSNTIYSFSVTGSSASQGTNRFKIVFTNTTPLDLKFVNLRAEKKEGTVKVDWNVNNQEGIKAYDVERSSDGKDFEKIASLEARNDDNYHHLDEAPFNSNNYYRIKAVARGSNAVYSNIVRVNMNQTNAELSTHPNPARGSNLQISVSDLAKGIYLINIYNAAGQKVATKELIHEGGSSQSDMNIESLAPGVYLMQLLNEQSESIADQKIIKQ